MDSFEWNKIAGAVLFALLVAFGLSIFSEIIFETEAPESPGYVDRRRAEEPARRAARPARRRSSRSACCWRAPTRPPARRSARKCAACHTFDEGEANKVGPNLWDVVNRPIAAP